MGRATTGTGDREDRTGGGPGSIGRGVEVLAGRAVGGRVDAAVVLEPRCPAPGPSSSPTTSAGPPSWPGRPTCSSSRGRCGRLRFTGAARDAAAGRLGAAGRVALVVDRVETWLAPVSAAGFVLVLLIRA
jgi:hypothetical protein